MFTLPKDEGIDDGMPVTVVYRRWREEDEEGRTRPGDVIALFPFIPASVTNAADDCMCYQHVGQHGAAEYMHVIEHTSAVDVEADAEAQDLRKELEDRGYSLAPLTHEEVCAEVGRNAVLKEEKTAVEKLAPEMFDAIVALKRANEQSTQDMRRAWYSSPVQSVVTRVMAIAE